LKWLEWPAYPGLKALGFYGPFGVKLGVNFFSTSQKKTRCVRREANGHSTCVGLLAAGLADARRCLWSVI
jgi:hypothetical protein